MKNWLIGKDLGAGQDWRQEEKETIENEMVGWHQWLNGHEFGQGLGVGDWQGSLACCSPWGLKESDTSEPLNWTEHQKISEVQLFWSVNQLKVLTQGEKHASTELNIVFFPSFGGLESVIRMEKLRLPLNLVTDHCYIQW